jgi:uncharacterized protein (TIGR02266 family)
MTAAHAYPDLTKQIRRSIELLDLALMVLRDEPFNDDLSQAAVTGRIEEAKTKLVFALSPNCPAYQECVVSGDAILEEALKRARELARLSSRQEQSLTAIDRARAILLPVVNRSTSVDAQPVSVRQTRVERMSQSPTGEQRRKHSRVELETEVTFEGPNNFYTGFSEDISEGGLFVSTYDIRPIGTKIEVSFSLPNGHIVNVNGEVRWLRDPVDPDEDSRPGMGIMFEELLPEDRSAVEAFIKSRNPIFFDE